MIGVFQSIEAPAPVRAKASSWRKTNEFKKENILKERGREEGRRERGRVNGEYNQVTKQPLKRNNSFGYSLSNKNK